MTSTRVSLLEARERTENPHAWALIDTVQLRFRLRASSLECLRDGVERLTGFRLGVSGCVCFLDEFWVYKTLKSEVQAETPKGIPKGILQKKT